TSLSSRRNESPRESSGSRRGRLRSPPSGADRGKPRANPGHKYSEAGWDELLASPSDGHECLSGRVVHARREALGRRPSDWLYGLSLRSNVTLAERKPSPHS